MTEPCDLPAVTARALIGERKLSPVELMESCIHRIEEIDPAVNAVIARSFETARATARESEAAVMRGDSLGPLHGLPLGVKDLIDAKGLPTSFGSVLFADNIAAEDEADCRDAQARRRDRRRQDQRPRMGRGRQHPQRASWRHRQPLRSRTLRRRLIRRIGGGARHRHGAAGDRFGHRRLGQEPRRVLRCRRFPPLARADRQQQPQHGLAADLAARADGEKRIGRLPDAFLHAGSRRARSAVGHPSRRRNAR